MIRDNIVVGLCDEQLSEKLQLDPNLTLKRAVDQARQKEVVRKQQAVVWCNPPEVTTNVDAMRSKPKIVIRGKLYTQKCAFPKKVKRHRNHHAEDAEKKCINWNTAQLEMPSATNVQKQDILVRCV